MDEIEGEEMPDIKIPEITKAPVIKERVSFDLKFDEEELKIDSDDLDFLEGEEVDEEEKELDDEANFYISNYIRENPRNWNG